ncbi:MAG: hypothetical protein R3C56_24515 [Pirellulaceae bacterium]
MQGISTESEAGLSRINELVDMLVARKVGAIFTESSVPQGDASAARAESKGHRHDIDMLLYLMRWAMLAPTQELILA